jgi:hypothetical protein
VSTRPVAPGPVDDDLPDHDAATMDAVFSRPMPDWTDRVGDWPASALPCAPLCGPVGPRRGSRLGGCCPGRSPLRAGIRPRVAHGGWF